MENYEIITHEKMYINQETPLVTVSFQLPYYDWLLIEESNEWSQIEKLLGELRNKRSQKSTQRRENQKRRWRRWFLEKYYMSFEKLEKNSKSFEMKRSPIRKLYLMEGLFLKLLGNWKET